MVGNSPYWGVVLVQTIYAGLYLISKAAFNKGMNTFIFVFYRQAFATLLLTPLAVYFEWKKAPPLSFRVLCQMFIISLLGITFSMDVGNIALVYTSPSLITAISNSLPVITFLISFLLGLETLKLKTSQGLAKLGGLVISLAGVLILAFYKGPSIEFLSQHPLFGHHSLTQRLVHERLVHETSHYPYSSRMTWIVGCFLILASNTCWSLWLVFQANMVADYLGSLAFTFSVGFHILFDSLEGVCSLLLEGRLMKIYPSRLLCTTIQCFFSSVQAFVVAIALERDVLEWELGWNIRLLAVAYSGFVVTGINFYLQTWIIEKKGPVFLALSTPLGFVITILCSTLLLGNVLSLASILGGILLILGLYSVLWGKIKEQASSSVEEIEKQGQDRAQI